MSMTVEKPFSKRKLFCFFGRRKRGSLFRHLFISVFLCHLPDFFKFNILNANVQAFVSSSCLKFSLVVMSKRYNLPWRDNEILSFFEYLCKLHIYLRHFCLSVKEVLSGNHVRFLNFWTYFTISKAYFIFFSCLVCLRYYFICLIMLF